MWQRVGAESEYKYSFGLTSQWVVLEDGALEDHKWELLFKWSSHFSYSEFVLLYFFPKIFIIKQGVKAILCNISPVNSNSKI